MVFQKKRTAPKNKLVRRKRMMRRPQRTLVNRALHPIPQRYITKMKYSELVSTNANGFYAFNLNSIFDPNRTGVGHQPYGFDTLATLYNRYRVIACGWRIAPVAPAVLASSSIQLGCLPANEELTGILSMSEVKENPRARYSLTTTGGDLKFVNGKTYIPSLVGRSKAQYMADDRYQSIITSNPNELAILNVYTATGNIDSTGTFPIQVLLEYTVEFFDIKHLAQS